jgi:hypothetical protein
MVIFICLLAAGAGWHLWRAGRRHGSLVEFFTYLMGIAFGFAIAFAALHTSE